MTVTRERQSDHSGWQTGGGCHARSRQRSDMRVRDFYREYVGCGKLKAWAKTHAFSAHFLFLETTGAITTLRSNAAAATLTQQNPME